MYAPLKVWRKWHRKINLKQRRYALVSAIAASGVPSLVLAKGLVFIKYLFINKFLFH
jgi:large subunit ribosomal protein L4e